VEADAHALSGRQHHVAVTIGNLDPCQLVALIEVNGNQTALAHIGVRIVLGTLDDTVAGDHDVVPVLGADVRGLNHAGNLLTLFQRQDVDYIGAAGGTGAFRYLVAFDAVDLALIGEEHQIVVGGAGIDVADKVLVTAGHAADSASAAALGLIDIQRLAF